MGRRRALRSAPADAASNFWAEALHPGWEPAGSWQHPPWAALEEDPDLSLGQLPTTFASADEYVARLRQLLMADARAALVQAWRSGGPSATGRRGSPAPMPVEVWLAAVDRCEAPWPARKRLQDNHGRGQVRWMHRLELQLPVGQAAQSWQLMRRGWAVELQPHSPGAQWENTPPMARGLFAVSGVEGGNMRLMGYAPPQWQLLEAAEEVEREVPLNRRDRDDIRARLMQRLQERMPAWRARLVEDFCPWLRVWHAAWQAPKVPFLGPLLGLKGPKLTVFSDSDAEPTAEAPAAVPEPCNDEEADGSACSGDLLQESASSEDDREDAAPEQEVDWTKLADWSRGLSLLSELNPSQQKAVQGLLARSSGSGEGNLGLHLVQGPPGTGKTKTIVCALRILQRSLNWKQAGKGGRPCVVVCAPSNKAVAVVLEDFLRSEEGADSAALLVGVDLKVPDEGAVREAFLHTKVRTHLASLERAEANAKPEELGEQRKRVKRDLQRLAPRALKAAQKRAVDAVQDAGDSEHELLRTLRILHQDQQDDAKVSALEQEMLGEATFLFSTLNCCGRPSVLRVLKRRPVFAVICDEAAQAQEAETLIALQLCPRSLVLIGDPQQLSSTVCHSRAAAAAGIQRSMMERILAVKQCVCELLDEQYRMHPEISRFVAARFYHGRLRDGVPRSVPGGAYGGAARMEPLRANLPPYLILDVPGSEVQGPKAASGIQNPEEAQAAVLLLRRLVPEALAQGQQVVCITFYAQQVAAISRDWRRSAESGPSGDAFLGVHTVDSFQGSEADVVLLSFVRANPRGRVGFLADFRRLNVALSRAKRHLIILANTGTFRGPASGPTPTGGDVAALFEDAAHRGVVQPLEEFMAQPPRKRRLKAGRSLPSAKEAKRLRKRCAPSGGTVEVSGERKEEARQRHC